MTPAARSTPTACGCAPCYPPAGASLQLLAPAGGSITLEQAGNPLAGAVSALSGAAWNSAWAPVDLLGGRAAGQSRISLAGAMLQIGGRGLEADLLRLSAGRLATDAGSVLAARLWYNDAGFGVGSSTSALRLALLPEAFATLFTFGSPDQPPQVSVGERGTGPGNGRDGLSAGYGQVVPRAGAKGSTAVYLAGPRVAVAAYSFFHDGAGEQLELPVFYNGLLPATPQLSGSLSAVASVSKTACREHFDETVRTENLAIRLRAGVIAEVGPGRPATTGSQGIRPPASCRTDLRPSARGSDGFNQMEAPPGCLIAFSTGAGKRAIAPNVKPRERFTPPRWCACCWERPTACRFPNCSGSSRSRCSAPCWATSGR